MMKRRRQPKTAECTLTKFSKKGNGLGIAKSENGHDTKVEISFGMPGDRVRATLFRKRQGIALGQIEEVLAPSSDRISPKCIHAGICGGCRWQHVPYSKQLEQKEKIIRHHFADLLANVDIRPIIPCKDPWHYRNKMEFSFSTDASGNRYLGLIIDSSKGKVLNVTECHLVNPWFAGILDVVRTWWKESKLDAYHSYRNEGALRTLTLREGKRTGDRMVMLTVSGNPDYALNRAQLEGFIHCMPPDISLFLRIQQIAKGRETQFYEMHLAGPDHIREILHVGTKTLTFNISPSAFFQPNTEQAEKLYSLALEMADVPKESIVYDLYCGTGTLGICAAQHAKHVIGIEISPESSLDARTNVALNNLENITILSGSVYEILEKMRIEGGYPLPDVVLVDPPRPGLDPQSLKLLVDLSPSTIVYVSCNPATQAPNIAELMNEGYTLTAMQAVDQFPHTVHIENVAVLKRNVAAIPGIISTTE